MIIGDMGNYSTRMLRHFIGQDRDQILANFEKFFWPELHR